MPPNWKKIVRAKQGERTARLKTDLTSGSENAKSANAAGNNDYRSETVNYVPSDQEYLLANGKVFGLSLCALVTAFA